MNEMRERVDIRLTKEEKNKLKELARDRGMTVSEYVREKIFGRKVTIRWQDQGKGSREL